ESKLFIPRLGILDAHDKTYREFVTELSRYLKSKLKNVEFTISLHKPREFFLNVLGAVENPGLVKATAQARASEVVERSGGVRARGSRQFAELRRNGETHRIDLLRFRTQGDFTYNPFVTESDVIFVPDL